MEIERILIQLEVCGNEETALEQLQEILHQKLSQTRSLVIRVVIVCPNLMSEPPAQVWKEYERLLSNVYLTVTRETYRVDAPLIQVDVVVDGHCGYDPWEWQECTDVYCAGASFSC